MPTEVMAGEGHPSFDVIGKCHGKEGQVGNTLMERSSGQ